jgi:DNA-binding transcriptional ArsR family regulator
MKTYWIERRDQIEALSNPIRQDIGDRLGALGPCSVAVLAAALGCRPTALYRHLQALKKVGLVQSVRKTGARGRPAIQYRTIAPLVRWARAPRRPENRRPMARAARAMTRQAAKDYALGFDAPHWRLEGPGRNHWVFRLVATLSPPRLKKINALLDRVAVLAYTPDPNPGPLVSISCVLAPVAERTLSHRPAPTNRARRQRSA